MNPDQFHLQQALNLAQLSQQKGEVPVGAVLVHDGQIIGAGHNQPISSCDPTAHAEVVALRQACRHLRNYRLPEGTTLYVTLEPCTMCVGALVHARVSRVVFAAFEPRAGALVSAQQLLNQGFYNHQFEFEGGLMEAQSRQLLQDFFRMRRAAKRHLAPRDDR